MDTTVPVGLGSVLGLLGTVGAGITTVVQSVEHNQALLTGTNKPAGIVACVSLIATVLGRMFQAAHFTKGQQIAEDAAQLPEALRALAGEAQVNLAKVQANPDGKDGPQVAFATVASQPPPAA